DRALPLSRQKIVPNIFAKTSFVEARIDLLIPIGGNVMPDSKCESSRVRCKVLIELPSLKIRFLVGVGIDAGRPAGKRRNSGEALRTDFQTTANILGLCRGHSTAPEVFGKIQKSYVEKMAKLVSAYAIGFDIHGRGNGERPESGQYGAAIFGACQTGARCFPL